MNKKSSVDFNLPLLKNLAKKYIWWETPEEAVRNPYRVLAGAMNLGSLEDYHILATEFDKERLSDVLRNAVPGWFSEKSWVFWHHFLDLIDVVETAPPLPQRTFYE